MHTDEALWHDADGAPRGDRPSRSSTSSSPTGRGRSSCSTRGPARCRAADYERFVLPHSRRVFAELAAAPSRTRRASTSASAATTCSRRCTPPGRSVIGLDWRTPIADAAQRLGDRHRRAGQPRPGARARRHRGRARRHRGGARRQRRPPRPHLQPRPRRAPRHRPRRAAPPSSTSCTSGRARRAVLICQPDRGVVLMAYGTPRSPDEIEPYYTDIRRGRPPTRRAAGRPRRAATRRSAASSPLAERTEAQRDALQPRSTSWRPTTYAVGSGSSTPTRRSRRPSSELAGAGRRAHRRPGAGPALLGDLGRPVPRSRSRRRRGRTASTFVGDRELGHRAGVRRLPRRRCAARLGRDARRTPRCCSPPTRCPERILAGGDPYPDELSATADAVAAAAGLGRLDRWAIAWQSAGRTPEPWIGPDILGVIDDLAARGGRRRRARLRVRLRRRSPRGALRPRHRGRPARRSAAGSCFDRTRFVNDDPR